MLGLGHGPGESFWNRVRRSCFLLALSALSPTYAADEAHSVASVALRLRLPPGESRLPAFLVLGGFQDAARVLDLIQPSQPVVLASFDYPFEGERVFHFPQSLWLLPRVRETVHGTLAAIPLVARWLAKHPRVDPERITLIGASVGAPFVLSAAPETEDARGIVLIHGFGKVPDTVARQFENSLRRKRYVPDFLVGPLAWLLSRGAWIYAGVPAPEEQARRLRPTQKVLVIDARDDTFISRTASQAQWDGIQSSAAVRRHRIESPGDHVQPGSAALIQEILEQLTRWLAQEGLLAPTVHR